MISGFVGPRLVGSLTALDLKTASKRVAASLRYARSQAATKTTTYFAMFDMDKNRLTIGPEQVPGEETMQADITETTDAEEGVPPTDLKHYDLPRNVTIQKGISGERAATAGLFSMAFFADGASSGGTVILSNKRGDSYRITADFITGTVHVESDEV